MNEVRSRILFPILNRDFMERHERYPPKGILLHGPPGTGKTFFAKILAAELSRLGVGKFSFFMRRGTDVMSMWVGESEKALRETFAKAVQCKPAILFFDEIDGLAPNRNTLQSTVPVYTNVVTTLLAEMDKLKNGEVYVIFATNRLEALDPALKRPGRCDVLIPFSPPDVNGRKGILQIYTKSWGASAPTERLLNQIALSTNGFTGADLDKLCSEAFYACVRRTQKGMSDCSARRVNDSDHVTERDWMIALGSMRPSASNVFGSYVQILEVSDFVQPLLRSTARNFVNLLCPHAPTEKSVQGPTGGPNCFLAWNTFPKCDTILDGLLVPTALTHLSHLAVYVLSDETMLQEHKHQFTIHSIIDIVQQAKSSPKPSILFIPRIDNLVRRLGGEVTLLRKLLADTAQKSVLVLATSSNDVTSLPPDLQALFDGHCKSYRMEKPKDCERSEFYAPIFQDYALRVRSQTTSDVNVVRKGACDKSSLNGLLKEVVTATDHEDLWSMITLHRELTHACLAHEKCANKVELVSKLKAIVEAYKKFRLDASRKPT